MGKGRKRNKSGRKSGKGEKRKKKVMNIKKGALKYIFYYTISQTSFHCFYRTGADTSDKSERACRL